MRRAVLLALVVVFLPGIAAALDLLRLGEVWINVYWLVAAGAALAVSLVGVRDLPARRRRYRLAVSASLALYLLGQLVWFAQVLIGWAVVPGPSDVLFLGCALVMTWALVRVVRHGVSRDSERIVVLDAIAVALAVVVTAAVLLEPRMADLGTLEATFLLLYPLLFLAPAGAALVSALALPASFRWRGIWVLLVAWLILGVSFSLWTVGALDGGQPRGPIDFLFGIGLLLSGYGAATWPNRPSQRASEVKTLRSISEALPVVALIVAVIAVLVGARTGVQAVVAHIGLIALLLLNAVRQGLLYRSLRKSEGRLRALAAELSASEHRERREIAEYLHDKVTQSLALLAMRFDELHGESDHVATERIERDIKELLRQTVADTRSATFDLSPPILYTIGLEASLEWLGESLCSKHGIEFSFSDDGIEKPLEADDAALLFRFGRELILNAIKHARAKRIELRVARHGADITVTVGDDGCGFDAQEFLRGGAPQGYGLFSVRERAVSLGGRLEIESSAEVGTRVLVSVPLRDPQAPRRRPERDLRRAAES